MKKCKWVYLIVGMIVCTALCSCGVTSHGNQGVTSQSTLESTSSQPTEKEDDPEAAYSELMGDIYDLILTEDKETDLELAAKALNGILEAGDSRTPDETLDCVGYALRDLNADGMPELVIGGIGEERSGKFFGRDIYAVYTCVQKNIYCICSGWSRSYVGWLGDNLFYHLGSNGAPYTMIGKYELLPNATEWSCVDLYFTDENGIYYNQTGINDREYAEALDMTSDEFWELSDELDDHVLEFELTPFSTGTYLGEKAEDHVAKVTVQWAEEALSTVNDYDEYIADSGEYSARVAFTATNPIEDCKVLALQYESIDEEGNVQFSTTELYNYGTLTADRVLVVEMTLEGTIPNYGISYKDAQGKTRLFSVNLSGYDGSLLLQEILQTR